MSVKSKKILSLLLVLVMSLSLLPVPVFGTNPSVDFAVLSTTDVHGKVWDTDLLTNGAVNNSLLKVSTAVQEIRDEFGAENVVLIDNGDLYQGTPVSSYQISQLTGYLSHDLVNPYDEDIVNPYDTIYAYYDNLVNPYEDEYVNPYLIDEHNDFMDLNPMALSLKYIGYDASVLGNHEFNYNWDAMNSIYKSLEDGTSSQVPILAANVYWDGTDRVHARGTNVFTPYITKDITVGNQTFKIGILGLENTDCTRWDVPNNYPGIVFSDPDNNPGKSMAWEVNKYVPLMQNAGCDFIILSYHSGLGSATGNLQFGVNTEDQIARVIANTTGVDMVIAGHDHSTAYSNSKYKNQDNKDVLVVNAGGTDLTKSVFTATLNGSNISVALKTSRNLNLSGYADDPNLKTLITPYANAAALYVNLDVGTLTGEWDSERNFYLKQSDTIDLINRAQIVEGGKHMAERYDTPEKLTALAAKTGLDHIDVDMSSTSVVVDGNYTASAGDIKMKDIYRMYKYDNTLYLLALTGQQIKDILEYNARNRLSASVHNGMVTYNTIGDSFTNPVFYGLNFEYDMSKAPGSRVVIHEFTNGRTFDLAEKYVFAINNYHLGNGPFADYSVDDAIWSQTGDLHSGAVQDLIADYVSSETSRIRGVSPDPSDWSLTWSDSLDTGLEDTAYIGYPTSEAPVDGDKVIIRFNNGQFAVGKTASGSNLSPSDITIDDKVLYAKDTAAAFTVGLTADGNYTFRTDDGKYLTSGATGSSLTLAGSANNYSQWKLEAATGGWLIRNANALYHDNYTNVDKPQYLEYYKPSAQPQGYFTTYGYTSGGSTTAFAFSFYKVVPAATLMEDAPKNDDQVAIWYSAGNQTIGFTRNSDGRLVGVDSAAAGNLLPVHEGSAVFDVHYDSATHYYTFTHNGKYLTSGGTGNSLSLADSANGCSYWTLESTAGGWLVRNVGAKYNGIDQYLEYYTNGFTTFGLQSNYSVYTYNFYQFTGFAPAAPLPDVELNSISIAPGSDETRMNFSWYSGVNTAGYVQVAKQTDLVSGAMPTSAAKFNAVTNTANKTGCYSNQATATGLLPNTTYAYQLVSGTQQSEIYTFTTDASDDFNFIFVGDPQLGCSGNLTSDENGWEGTLEAMTEQVPDAAFLLSAGDQVEAATSEPQYSAFLEHSQLYSLPVATTIGNHDSGSNAYSQHFNVANESTDYGVTPAGGDSWFRYNDVLFMTLNVNDMSTAEHRAFMEAAISTNSDAKWRIVTMHHSVYSVASHAFDTDVLQRRAELVPVFKELDIDVVLQGHDHVYTRSYMMDGLTAVTDPAEYDSADMNSVTDTDDILYVTANSASGSKYYDIQNTQFEYAAVKNQEHVPTFSKVHVSDTAFTITTYRSSDLSVVDTFTINRTPTGLVLTGGSATRTSDTDATVTFTSHQAGTYYYTVVDDGTAVTSVDTTGTGVACEAETETAIHLTGLTAGAKDIYIVVKDAEGNISEMLKMDIDAFPHYTLAIGSESAGGAGYRRNITITGEEDLNGKYLVVQFTYGSGTSAKVSVVMIKLSSDSTEPSISYQNPGTRIEAWLTSGMPDLVAQNMGVTIYANARTN